MHCEFCDVSFDDLAGARRHMLTVTHVREKRKSELSSTKLLEKIRQAAIRPKDLNELTKLLNIHSSQDAIALDNLAFFKLERNYHSMIARELIKVLNREMTDFYLKSLPEKLRQPLVSTYDLQKYRDTD